MNAMPTKVSTVTRMMLVAIVSAILLTISPSRAFAAQIEPSSPSVISSLADSSLRCDTGYGFQILGPFSGAPATWYIYAYRINSGPFQYSRYFSGDVLHGIYEWDGYRWVPRQNYGQGPATMVNYMNAKGLVEAWYWIGGSNGWVSLSSCVASSF